MVYISSEGNVGETRKRGPLSIVRDFIVGIFDFVGLFFRTLTASPAVLESERVRIGFPCCHDDLMDSIFIYCVFHFLFIVMYFIFVGATSHHLRRTSGGASTRWIWGRGRTQHSRCKSFRMR